VKAAILLPLRLFHLVVHQEEHHNELDFIDGEEAARARLLAVAEHEVLFARRRRQVLAAVSDEIFLDPLAIVPEAVKLLRVREYARVTRDRPKGEGEVRASGDVDAVAQGDSFPGFSLGKHCEKEMSARTDHGEEGSRRGRRRRREWERTHVWREGASAQSHR